MISRPNWALFVAALVITLASLGRCQAIWRGLPDYGFGWAVPVLAIYLGWERWLDRPEPVPDRRPEPFLGWIAATIAVVALAVLRLALEPFPLWPMALWMYTAVAVALGLLLIALAGDFRTARHFAFPLSFIFTALPWPTIVDTSVIYPLRHGLAEIAAEAVNQLGYPAIAQGTFIQVGSGTVAVDEACSGIRSLQATLMVALFLGELFRFGWKRRIGLTAIGAGLAVSMNLFRTLFLSWESALHGQNAVEQWHDLAGYALLALAMASLVWTGWHWRHRGQPVMASPLTIGAVLPSPRWITTLGLVVALAIIGSEAGTQWWYARGDQSAQSTVHFKASLPTSDASFHSDVFTEAMQSMLRCDAHQIGHWTTQSGSRCAAYILNWRKGQVARFTLALHNPSVCLPAGGSRQVADRGILTLQLGPIALPFHAYVFVGERETMHVFYLAWDVWSGGPLRTGSTAKNAREWITQQWAEVRGARRNFEAEAITVAIYGATNNASADEMMRIEAARILFR